MKRIIILLLAGMLCISAASCSKQPDTMESTSDLLESSSDLSGSTSDSGSTNYYLEQLRTALPHNMNIKFTDLKDTVIEFDSLVISEEIGEYTADGTEWYTTEDSVAVNGFAFSPAVYTFTEEGKINSLSYYSLDDSDDYTTYAPEYTYSSLVNYFESIYGDPQIRNSEDGETMCYYWVVNVDGTDTYTMEVFYMNQAESSGETSGTASGEAPSEYVLIAIYRGVFS